MVLADEAPYVPLEQLLERPFDLVLCLGDLTRVDLEPLGRVRVPKLGVHGNHDDGGEFTGLGIESVHLRRVEVAGLTFGGFSGSHEYGRGAGGDGITWSQTEASRRLRRFGHVDVMLAHSPPLGINDDADDPAHVGLAGLSEYVEREHPAMLLHGHTYPPLPVERFGRTQVRHVRGHRFVALPAPAR
ncbi:MAG TPA: metallophosphoesterase [Solirubrobacteraceae bacterium]